MTIGFEHIEITVIVLLAACAAFSSLYGVFKIVKELKHPNEERDKKLHVMQEKIEAEEKRLDDLTDATRILLRAQLCVIDHILDGDNHLTSLESSRVEITEYLLKR